MRYGLKQVVLLAPDLRVEEEAKSGWETLNFARSRKFDVAVMRIDTAGQSGMELIRRLRLEVPGVPIVALTTHTDWQVAAQAIMAGASGYLTTDSEPEELIEAIRKVGSGGKYINPALAAQLVFQSSASRPTASKTELTEREHQVFLGLVRGDDLNSIAASLHLSPKTISTHKLRLMKKLQINSMSALVRYAIRHGFIE